MMNPQDTNWPSPPAGAPQMPMMAEAGAQEGPDESDPMYAETKAMMDQLGTVMDQSASLKTQGDNEAELAKSDAIRSILMALQDQGVDLADPASINAYRMKLQERNPDFLILFDKMMDTLLGEDTQTDPSMDPNAAPEDQVPPTGQMNNPNDIAQAQTAPQVATQAQPGL